MSAARYIMIGGFLGAGKTTAVLKLAKMIDARGERVGLITNDQGTQLVDSLMLRSNGFKVEEISGGCFCCRFNSLKDAADKLNADSRPNVFIAEPVGSCTDLVATVSYPLRRMYGDDFTIAPLSVLIDPLRAERILGLEDGAKFSEKVAYIYLKQLEEADLIVVNKTDLLDAGRLARLIATLTQRFAKARIITLCARTGAGIAEWLALIEGADQSRRAPMPVDYDVYADGEALLGWLNATVAVDAADGVDGNKLVQDLMLATQKRLVAGKGEIAHLKMTLSPEDGSGEIATINLVRNEHAPELSQSLLDDVERAQLIINLRAEADPTMLKTAVTAAVAEIAAARPGVQLTIDHCEHFKPGRPVPTHRFTAADAR